MSRKVIIIIAVSCIAAVLFKGCNGGGPSKTDAGDVAQDGDADMIPPDPSDAPGDADADQAEPDGTETDQTEPDATDVPADTGEDLFVPVTAREFCDVDTYHYAGYITGCRNGSERCDDQMFTVPSDPYVPLVLGCYGSTGDGGIAYIGINSGPQCTQDEGCCPSAEGVDCPVEARDFNSGNFRCRGWEQCGCPGQLCPCADAWDFIEYATDPAGNPITITCTVDGVVQEIDLSAYAGQNIYVGVHTQPDGATGRGTESCIARKP